MIGPKVEKLVMGDKKRVAFVVDDLVEPGAMPVVYKEFKRLPYRLTQADSRGTTHAKHFAYHFSKDSWQHPVVSHFLEATESVLRDHRLPFRGPNRIYANLTLFGDYNFPHYDACDWTMLVFVNDQWKDDWGGDFTLYRDANCDAPSVGIRPKPGRMVIFDGSLLHRPGVPTKYCLEPRITLAAKIGEQKKRWKKEAAAYDRKPSRARRT